MGEVCTPAREARRNPTLKGFAYRRQTRKDWGFFEGTGIPEELYPEEKKVP